MKKVVKVTANENIDNYARELDNLKKDDVDLLQLRSLVNESIHIMRKALRSKGTSAKEKRDKALAIVSKYMPSGMTVTHEVGDSFLNIVKEVNTGKPPRRKSSKKVDTSNIEDAEIVND